MRGENATLLEAEVHVRVWAVIRRGLRCIGGARIRICGLNMV